MIYLALLTERIPIIAKFPPSHMDLRIPPFPFGEVFDVPRLSKTIGSPILEWHEVKDPESEVLDDLGCWNVWETVNAGATGARETPPLRTLKLGKAVLNIPAKLINCMIITDISWTLAPKWIKLTAPEIKDVFASFWSLATLGFPETRSKHLGSKNVPSPQHQVSLPPDDHLLCFDFLYYVSAQNTYEWDKDYSPAWRFVGQHMHWNATLERIAGEHARRAMNIPADEPTPPVSKSSQSPQLV